LLRPQLLSLLRLLRRPLTLRLQSWSLRPLPQVPPLPRSDLPRPLLLPPLSLQQPLLSVMMLLPPLLPLEPWLPPLLLL
jgi:hypothetical protein